MKKLGGGVLSKHTFKSWMASFMVLASLVLAGLFAVSGSAIAQPAPPQLTVSAISPPTGDALGGTAVTISGTGFTGALGVTIGGQAATGVSVVNDTTITATTPAGAAGTASVLVTTASGTNAANSLYGYFNKPVITGVTVVKTEQNSTCSYTITLTGRNFTGVTSLFYSTPATGFSAPPGSFVVQNDNTIINTLFYSASLNSDTGLLDRCNGNDIGATGGGGGTARILYFKVSTPQATSDDFRWDTTGALLPALVITQHWRNIQAGYTASFPFQNQDGYGFIDSIQFAPTRGNVELVQAHNPETDDLRNYNFKYTPFPQNLKTAFTDIFNLQVSLPPSQQNLAVYVLVTNSYPVLKPSTPIAITNAPVARSLKVDDLATDPDADPLSFVALPTASPVGCGTVAKVNDSEMSFTPAAGFVGACNVAFTATDGVTGNSPRPDGTLVPFTPAAGTQVFNITAAPAAPTVASITPATGPAAGGTAVTIAGTGFTAATGVTIGGAPATGVSVVNDTTITATTPAGTAPAGGLGTASVLVTTASGSNAGNSLFSYFNTPVITGVGLAKEHLGCVGIQCNNKCTTTLTGRNFTGVTSLLIASPVSGFRAPAQGSFIVQDDSTIIHTIIAENDCSIGSLVGSSAGLSSIILFKVSTSQATSNEFQLLNQLPGSIGHRVITQHWRNMLAGYTSSFPFHNQDGYAFINSIQFAPTFGSVVVVNSPNPDTQDVNNYNFKYTPHAPYLKTAFTDTFNLEVSVPPFTEILAVYVFVTNTAPVLKSKAPIAITNAQVARSLKVDDLARDPDADPLSFAAIPTLTPANCGSIAKTSDTEMNFTPAAGFVGQCSINFSATDGVHRGLNGPLDAAAGTQVFNITADPSAPTVASITPATGLPSGGTVVTITGTGFTNATGVTIGGAAAAFTFVNDTEITATTPTGTAGTASVVVTSPLGANAANGLYTYAEPSFALTVNTSGTGAGTVSSAPAGITCGATCSANFDNGTSVSLTATPDATSSFTGWSGGGCSGTGSCVVTLTAATGVTATFAKFVPAPTVSAISPASGLPSGGTDVTLTGTGFTGATAVTIGGAAATNLVVVSDTQITATSPAGTVGPASVIVTTPIGVNDADVYYTYAKAAQVVAFTSTIPAAPVVGGTYTPAATSNSNLPVAFGVTGTCSIASGKVSFTGAGLCTVSADQAGNDDYEGASQVQQTITINPASKLDQVINFEKPADQTYAPHATVTLNATGGASGNPVTFVSNSATVCSVSSTTATILQTGTCSITASQAGNSSFNPAVAVSQSFTIGLVASTVSLEVAPTSVVLGQTVVLTATVSPSVDSGAVAFSDGNSVICAAVTPVDGVATCSTAFTTAGAHSLSATYSGSQAVSSSTASPVAVHTVDQKVTESKSVGGYISDRANLIATSMFDIGRQIDRLNLAKKSNSDTNGSGNFAETGKGDLALVMQSSRLGGPSAATITAAGLEAKTGGSIVGDQDVLALQSFMYDYLKAAGQSGNFGAFNFNGPMDMHANFAGGQGKASFKASLSQLTNWQQKHDKTEMNALGFGHNMANTVFMPLDVWVEGNFATYSGNRSGQFGMASLGADYVLNPSLLVGVYSQFDMMNQTSETAISGNGWMAGPYVTARLSENMFWQAHGGWGTSRNIINDTDKFNSTRWLLSSSLSGRWKADNGLTFTPTASFTYFEDKSAAYIDSFNTTIPGTRTNFGQLKLSPELSYGFNADNGLSIEPNIATELIWNSASTNIEGQGQLDGTASGPMGLRGKVRAGVNIKTPSGISFSASTSYDGIGSQGFSSLAGQATLSVPLN